MTLSCATSTKSFAGPMCNTPCRLGSDPTLGLGPIVGSNLGPCPSFGPGCGLPEPVPPGPLCQAMLKKRADVNATNECNMTPLDLANKSSSWAMYKAIEEAGGELQQTTLQDPLCACHPCLASHSFFYCSSFVSSSFGYTLHLSMFVCVLFRSFSFRLDLASVCLLALPLVSCSLLL